MSMAWSPNSPLPPKSGPGVAQALLAIFRTHISPLTARLRTVLARGKPSKPEDDLAFLQAYFANIVELSEDAIISVDADHRIRLFNKGAETIFGYRAQEVLGRSLNTLIPPQFQARHSTYLSQFAASPDAIRPMHQRRMIAGIRKDGAEFPAEATISKFAVHGETVLTVRLRDITQRQQAEEGLRRLAAIVESSDDAIVGMSCDGTVITWNAGAERLYDYGMPEAVGQQIALLVPSERQDELSDLFARVLRGESVTHFETVRLRMDGTPLEVSISLSPLKDAAGAIVGMSAIGRDITQQKRLEAQLRQAQKMEAIGTLAGGIAHDFNNLLNVVSGHAELAAIRLPHGSPAQEHLQEVIAASQHATDLVRQILAFTRQTPHERRAVALQTVLDDVKRLLRATLPSTIDFRQHADATPAIVLADPPQIQQVLLNLCANAEYAMRDRGGVLDLQLRTVDVDAKFAEAHPPLQPGPHVKLTVRDTGNGMPLEIQERIFEPFFTTKPVGEGTGLGLAVVHNIVTGHGGIITVESAPGRGARFDLYLPLCDDAVHAPESPQAPARGEGEHILLVDDEPPLVRLWMVTLRGLGYRVTAYSNGRDALEAFRDTPDAFDLVITDQTMPQLTGEALARGIVRLRPRLPIILCTGNLSLSSTGRTTPAGVRAMLTKPVSRLELSLAIRRVLAEHPAARQAARVQP